MTLLSAGTVAEQFELLGTARDDFAAANVSTSASATLAGRKDFPKS
jgi:hypothetical protein